MMKILAISSVVGASAIQWVGHWSQACSNVYTPNWHAVAECIKHMHTAGGCDKHAGNDLDACVLQVTAGRSSSFVQEDDHRYIIDDEAQESPSEVDADDEDSEDDADDEESSFVQKWSREDFQKAIAAHYTRSLLGIHAFANAKKLQNHWQLERSSSFVEAGVCDLECDKFARDPKYDFKNLDCIKSCPIVNKMFKEVARDQLAELEALRGR